MFGKPPVVFGPGKGHPQSQQTTPMSISTRNTLRKPFTKNHFQNFGQKPNFISEELFQNDNLEEDVELEYTDDEAEEFENFSEYP